jgi:hypothetical protein
MVYLGAWNIPFIENQTVYSNLDLFYPAICGPAGLALVILGVSSVTNVSRKEVRSIRAPFGIIAAAAGVGFISTSKLVLDDGISPELVSLVMMTVQAVVVLAKAALAMFVFQNTWNFMLSRRGQAAFSAGVKFSTWASAAGIFALSLLTVLGLI